MTGRLTARGLPFYYGWIVFAVTFLIYMFMYGLRYSVGVFFTPIQQEFDWSTAVTASAVTIFFWVYAASAPLVGSLAEKMGVRRTVLFGGLLLGGGGFLVSFVQELWHLYLFWGIIAAVGAAALYIVPTMALSRFFLRKRGRAVGWSSVGVSAGQAIFVPVVAVLIQEHGWRLAIRGFSLAVVTITSVLGYLFIREDPVSMGLSVDGEKYEEEGLDRAAISSPRLNWEPRKAMKTSSFRLLALSYFFAVGGIISILTFAVPRMIDIGIDPVKAGGAFGIIGAMSAAGSFLFGIFSDRLGRRATIYVTTAGIALSFFTALTLPPNLILLYAWAILYGLTYGGCPEQYAAIIADYFGNRYSTTIFGFITLAGGLGGGLFPLIGGWLVDLSGTYNWTLWFLAGGMCVATLLIFFTNPPRAKD
jgi:MFS family permease